MRSLHSLFFVCAMVLSGGAALAQGGKSSPDAAVDLAPVGRALDLMTVERHDDLIPGETEDDLAPLESADDLALDSTRK